MKWILGQRYLELSRRTIVVDDTSWAGGALNLDHHIGNRTPKDLMGEVATEIVLGALAAGLEISQYRWASIRHYDTDGCLALWSLFHPEEAFEHQELLIKAAKYGDFYELDDTDAGRRALILSSYLQEYLTGFIIPRDKGAKESLLRYALEKLHELLRQTGRPHQACQPYVRRFEDDLHWLYQHASSSEHSGGVVLLESPRELSLGALMSKFSAPVIIAANRASGGPGWEYAIYLRPKYSWGYAAEAVGVIPVRDLKPARKGLALLEARAGGSARWVGSSYDGSLWKLHLLGAASRLEPEVVRREVQKLLLTN